MNKPIRAIFKTGFGTAISICFGIIAMKIMAWLTGPTGVGLFSLIRQTQQTAITIGGGQIPLTQGLASRSGGSRNNYLGEVSGYILLLSLGTIITIFLLAPWLGPLIFGKQTISVDLIRILCIPISIGFLFVYFNGVLNGNNALNQLIIGQIINAAIVGCLAYPASLLFKQGVTTAFVFILALGMLGSVFYSFVVSYKVGWLDGLRVRSFTINTKSHDLRKFVTFSMVSTFTSFFATATVLIIRSLVVHRAGLYGAGIFDVAWTLSTMYLQLILSAFATYYLPTLSGINDKNKQAQFIKIFLSSTIVLGVPVIVFVIIGKPLVISLFYTAEFNPALKIIRWMLIGDFIKLMSWVLATPMVALRHVRAYFWSELISNIILLFLVYLAMYVWDSAEYIGLAFLLNYVLYFVYTLYYAHRKLMLRLDKKIFFLCFLGLAIIIAASFNTWDDIAISWCKVVIWPILAALFSCYWLLQMKSKKDIM